MNSNDPIEDEFDLSNIQYKTKGVFQEDAHDSAWVYDCRSLQDIGPNTYTTSELISIELYDLVNEYTIPREAYRKLVRLMNTMIRDTEKLARGKRKKS